MKLLKMGLGLLAISFIFIGCTTTGSIRGSLIDAVESGDLEEVKSQLAQIYGNAWHMRDENGKTLLQLATEYGHTDIVQYFLANGINPDTTDRIGDTALQIAAYNGYSVISFLYESGNSLSHRTVSPPLFMYRISTQVILILRVQRTHAYSIV